MGNELNDHFNEINQLLVQNKDILSSKLYDAITSRLLKNTINANNVVDYSGDRL
jgi:hypothetical protein